jgi:DNA-binding CsgD family transcriptional regulator
MTNTKQAAQQEAGSVDSSNTHIQRLLHQRARERAAALRWNTNTLILASVNLTAIIILTLKEVDSSIIALVAVFGLALLWLFSWLQVRRLENRFYEQETRDYTELSSAEPSNGFNGTEASSSVSSAESLLTYRELEILERTAQGKTNKEIASALQISEQTVKNHISHIFWKLSVNDRTSAVVAAMRHGWIKGDHMESS